MLQGTVHSRRGAKQGDAVGPAPRRFHTVATLKNDFPPWFRERGYAHFDERPVPESALAYACDPAQVASHAFWPFIQFTRRTPRYKRDPETGKRAFSKFKERPISYAAHLDSHIFSKYAADLSTRLEAWYLVSVAAKREAHGDRKFIDVSEPIALA